MNSTHALRLLAVCGLPPTVSAGAFAQVQKGGCYYGGPAVGAARPKLDAEAITLEQAGVTASSFQRDDRDATTAPAGRSSLRGGNLDLVGLPACDQMLSQERADAVKSYLVTSGKVDPMTITAVGKGEGSPVTAAGDCKGTSATAALIACLQPDRRVEIEVSGTR